ncbi:hypothetical protein [Nocardia sp. SYP-A9097]|uniref:hypothetical protein n=1 Tax=Nocardia sp. SYP-A9097 TaxID=2663237 RepID=UPI001E39E06D|nr:hypothetical protein [Nocardia sp. SYP-A9097]
MGVIDLPHRVRALGAASVDQLVGIAERDRSLVREGEQGRVECGDDRANSVVGHRNPALIGGDAGGAAGDRRQRRARAA